ncbi:HlyD family efflux transporter periplasmic adaptor subunit [Chlorogloeopsis sp. ULAP01]|uniref:HlyD family secretion protein n=1 Tax=Chlorogloeopsis sp. ULAP01 TaxID=3056483 RepID=UPI0025AAB48E|nr:HlyD family efflux transporter periplasmic adaptor subunit [Chlorogloeopsis sp. ULAP01]MDM9383823.1 HlyD family efflux transporter periplasmic adaptor subunit [Chlorogloeopsis sp. ULAP01]
MTTQFVPKSQKGEEPQQLVEPKQHEPPIEPPSGRKLKLPLLILGGILMAAAIATPTWYYLSRPQPSGLELSGRIEGYETDIGAKISGRVNFVAVREGDRVTRGHVVAKLDDEEIQAQLQGAKARITAAEQQVEQARMQISVIQAQIQEAQFNWQQAQDNTQGIIAEARSQVAAAEAQLSQAQADLQQAISNARLAQINRDRVAQLHRDGAFSQQQFDEAQTNLETAQATVKARQAAVSAANKKVKASEGALVQAQTTKLNPNISKTRIAALREQQNIAKAQLAVAQAEVKNAQATEKQILAQIAYLNVTSPIDGVVTARTVEPGAVVGSGKTLLTIIDPNTVYMRGFIPEGEIGKVKIGQPAKVWLDSFPKQPLNARVSAVDTQASFTPENIYFKQDRVKQVFGVKLSIEQSGGFAKPGMPADAVIEIEKKN